MDIVCVCVCVHMRCFVYARKIVHLPILFECGKCGKNMKRKRGSFDATYHHTKWIMRFYFFCVVSFTKESLCLALSPQLFLLDQILRFWIENKKINCRYIELQRLQPYDLISIRQYKVPNKIRYKMLWSTK